MDINTTAVAGEVSEQNTNESAREGRDVPFWEAFQFWLKLGLISFAGPAGQIAIMHKELVDHRR